MGLQGERTRGEKTKNFLMRRGIKQQGNTSTASCKDESWHQFLPKRAGNSLGMIDGCPSSAPASEQLKHRDTALLTLRNGTSQSPLDAWEDLRPCFKSQPFPSPTYLLCLRAWKACQDAGNLSIPHTEQTHVMGRLHKEPRLHQDFWWFFSCLFFYDPRSWGNITFRGKRLFFFFFSTLPSYTWKEAKHSVIPLCQHQLKNGGLLLLCNNWSYAENKILTLPPTSLTGVLLHLFIKPVKYPCSFVRLQTSDMFISGFTNSLKSFYWNITSSCHNSAAYSTHMQDHCSCKRVKQLKQRK